MIVERREKRVLWQTDSGSKALVPTDWRLHWRIMSIAQRSHVAECLQLWLGLVHLKREDEGAEVLFLKFVSIDPTSLVVSGYT
jgi:hypothetical protein